MDKAKIEDGMYRITNEQKELLKQLANSVQKLAIECERDNIFNSFIASLDIFNFDLLETFDIILDNTEDYY